jgi:alanyl-tRNA synthetase
MNQKLYHKDPYRHTFTSPVLEHLEVDDQYAVLLKHTAFYPTSGGQPYDRGTLNGIPVLEVRETDEHQILHLLEAPLMENMVEGRIDWDRRFDHMQQHTGQHLLSQACLTVCEADTISFHLGKESSTIDVTLPDITPGRIAEIEKLANQIIYENRPVHIHWLSEQELRKFPVRKMPTVKEPIRLVEIHEFDFSPCGGTHCANTGELGSIKVIKWENYKGGARLHFVCGWRALRDYQHKAALLKDLSDNLTAGEADLPQLLTKLQDDNKTLRREVTHVSRQLVHYEAQTLLGKCERRGEISLLTQIFDNRSQSDLKTLAAAVLDQTSQTVVLFGSRIESKAALVFSRTRDLSVNMNDLMKAACTAIGGRGGGSLHQAQGGGPDVEKLDKALEMAGGEVLKMGRC